MLVVDNCEHLIAEAAEAVAAIQHDAPGVHIIATSREPLNIGGEHVYRIPSLSLRGAVALFVERACAADANFRPDGDNAALIAEVCRRLDGLPLAVELAAARARTMSIAELARRIEDRLSVLAGSDRLAPPRHRTMRGVVDWSYDLLDAQEKALFRRLGIFPVAFTLESVAAVCAGDDIAATGAFTLLSSLIDKSLVAVDLAGETTRYRLLETTRQYALEKLDEQRRTRPRRRAARRRVRRTGGGTRAQVVR